MSENGKTAAAGSTAEKAARANGKHGGFAVGKLWPIIAQTEGRLKALFQTASTAFAVSQISMVNQLKKKVCTSLSGLSRVSHFLKKFLKTKKILGLSTSMTAIVYFRRPKQILKMPQAV